MVSVTGTQHRHAQAAASKQTQGGDDAVVHGKSAMSVGHLAKAQLLAQQSSEDAAPNAIGKAAAVIAKMTLDQRAELLESLKNPSTGGTGPADPTDPDAGTPPTDPTDGAGTTDPATGGETTETPAEAGSTDQTPPVQPDPSTDEPATDPDAASGDTETTTSGIPPVVLTTDTPVDDTAAISILEQILAAADQNSQPV